MQRQSTQKVGFFQNLDYLTIFIYLLLVAIGWVTIYAAGYEIDNEVSKWVLDGRVKYQLIWIGISAVVALVLLLVESNFIKSIAPPFYLLMILLLIATIFIGAEIKGSSSWIRISSSVQIQPAEFAKISTALMLSWWCSRYEFDIKKPLDLIISLLIFLIPIGIIILQSETGSALVFLSFLIVLYREGLTSAVLLYGIFLAILFIITLRFSEVCWGITNAGHCLVFILIYFCTLFGITLYSKSHRVLLPATLILPIYLAIGALCSIWLSIDFAIVALLALLTLFLFLIYAAIKKRGKHLFTMIAVGLLSISLSSGVEYFFENILQPHQQVRILVALGMKDDPSGANYNVRQSLIAIGSGGVTGKGFLNGTQTKLAYVPEQDTDFIFCTIGEEQGFLGSTALLLLYFYLLYRIIRIAERQEQVFNRIYGYSVVSILFFHLIVNIGMVIGLVPVIGIPLPFISYGGSSLLSFTILLFILLRLDSQRPQIKQ